MTVEHATRSREQEERLVVRREFRMSPDGKMLSGYAALYDSKSVDVGYIETIAPGAFDRSLARDDEVLALVEHDSNRLLGRRSAGTLRLSSDDVGLAFEIDIPDTTLGRDVREQVRRGDLSQMSFAFEIEHELDEELGRNADGQRTRRILAARLWDVSVVAQPAYEETSINVRSYIMPEPTKMDEVRRLTVEMRSILDGEVNAEASEQYDRMELRLTSLEQDIRSERRSDSLARVERLLEEPTRSAPTPTDTKPENVYETRAYSEAFFANLTGSANVEQRDMLAGSGSGANIVPTEMEAAITELLDAPQTMRGICSVTQARGDREVPVETAIGSGGWLAEQGTISTSDVTLVKRTASPKSYGTAIAWSSLQASNAIVSVDAYFGRAVGRTMSAGINSAYLVGTGSSNQPTGLVTALGTPTYMNLAVNKGDAIMDAVAELDPQYRVGARWMMNDTTLTLIRKLKDDDGAYLWKQAERYSDLREGVAGSLLGYPVTIDSAMANTSILFGDIARAYRIFDWGSTTLLVDPYSSASTMTTTLWAWRQTDGIQIDANAAALFDTDAS